ncbi:FKBP-type peptidyl-prolyl cis-trans isomerase [Microbacterium sp. cf046]|uniref:FKBP-type peptidyl-prolyl cis-trans isomerase n=1 Tax=Microbacterium sp. cf046 TaxID=1761803 RepID=UPI000B82C2AF|nr:FKBP-type peptidyl-prolyl cis-trans isomerase [Microbacterium sp. cf046]
MRIRPIVALSAFAVSAVLLAGCSAGSPDSEASPTATAVADLCDSAAPSGEASEAVTVEGEVGTPPTATFDLPLEITEIQRTVVDEGPDELTGGEFIEYAYSVFDAETGESLATVGYEPGETLPQQVSAESGGQLFGCAGAGSRIVAAAPAGDTTPAVVYVIDILSVVPIAAWGEEQPPVAGSPTVELAENGAPTITLPAGDAPTATQVDVLKKGDGATVQTGDTVLVQYTGVKWSDGTVFDSTWEKGGVPTTFATTGVVAGFQKALEGQTVGSQVLVVIPPVDGYGEGEINDTDLVGETLVFVVDILGTQRAVPAQ